jgi:hypothetical protein
VGVVAEEVLVRRARIEVAIREVAAPAARDADLLGDLGRVVDQQGNLNCGTNPLGT